MSRLARIVRGGGTALVHFWTKPVRAEPLAAFRILVGASLFLSISLTLLPRLHDYVGPRGLCPLQAAEPWLDRGRRVDLLRGPQHVPLLECRFSEESKACWRAWGEQPNNVRKVVLFWLLAMLAMTLGLATRLSTFAVWVIGVTISNHFSWVRNGGDSLSQVALFYLLISPAGKVWSLDALILKRWRRNREAPCDGPVLIPAWSLRLAQIQIAVVYLTTGVYKVWSEGWGRDWLDGSAVYWLLNDVALTRWPYSSFPVPMWLCKVLSWGTIVFEIGFSLFVLFRWTRPAILLGGLLFHLGILLTTEVGWFSIATLSWYPLFISGKRLQGFVRWLFRRGTTAQANPPPPAP